MQVRVLLLILLSTLASFAAASDSSVGANNDPTDRVFRFCCVAVSSNVTVLQSSVFQSEYLVELTPCFEDILIMGSVNIVVIIMGVLRILALRTSRKRSSSSSSSINSGGGDTVVRPVRNLGVHRVKMLIVAYLSASPIFIMFIRAGGNVLVPYQVVSLAMTSTAWFLILIVLFLEQSHFLKQGKWMLSFIFVFTAFAYGVRLKSVMIFADIGETYYTILYFISFAGILFLVALTAAVKQAASSSDHVEFDVEGNVNEKDNASFLSFSGGVRRLSDIVWPKYTASLLSKLFFQWIQPLVSKGYKSVLEELDVWQLHPNEKAEKISPKFESAWERQVRSKNNSLLSALWEVFGSAFIAAALPKLVNDASQFVGPLLLQALIRFTTNSNIPDYMGYVYAVSIFVGTMIGAIGENIYFDKVMTIGMHLRTALVTGIYRKSLRLSNNARQKHTGGSLVNMMENDTNRLTMLVQNLHLLWSSPLRILVSLVLLFLSLGVAAIAGIMILVLLIPAQSKLVKMMQKLRKKITTHTDKRLSLTSEIVSGMKVIKFYAWEKSFLGKVSSVRNEELASLRSTAFLRCINFLLMSIGPVVVSVATFSMFGILSMISDDEKYKLTAARAFTALSLLNVLRYPLIFFPSVVSSIADARVSVNRIQDLLCADETEEPAEDRVSGATNHYVSISRADFSFSQTGALILTNVSLEAPKSSLTVVVGGTGSGKSSLLSAVLGDMVLMRGEREVRGKIAYVAQTSWIFNASLKDNVVFGLNYEKTKFDKSVHVSALERDLDLLVAAEETELGERGGNLSGGQRQRVSIARAVYADADIYIMDDPLSALDSKVGRFVFEECVLSHLSRKTRIIATNQLQYCRYADQIVVMKDGSVAEVGDYKTLTKNDKSLFAAMMRQYGSHDDGEEEEGEGEEGEGSEEGDDAVLVSIGEASGGSSESKPQRRKAAAKKKPTAAAAAVASPTAEELAAAKKKKEKAVASGAGQLVVKEERDTGSVSFGVYLAYLAAAGGKRLGISAVFALIAMQVIKAVTNWWLSYWSANGESHSIAFYLGVYAALSVGLALIQLLSSLQFTLGGLKASDILHQKMIRGIIRSPMMFFDSTPLGRIMNRFTKDLTNVDNNLPAQLELFIRGVFDLLGTLAVIGATTPYFLVVVVPVVVVFLFVQAYFRRTTRELKRLDAITRSPIFAHFSETLNGISTIRAFVALDSVTEQNARRVDHNQRFYFASISCNRWLSIRLEFLGGSLVLAAAIFAVVARRAFADQAGLVGLSLGYALQITSLLNMIIRLFTESENNFNSVERVNNYISLPSEAPPVVENNRPDDQWPNKGRIEFQNVTMRYRPGMPPVLRGIGFEIRGGEKIGVCGRTGAGKSSLFQALFRIVEAEAGSVMIDGMDVQKIGLEDLRSRLAIIPQEPILFAGTLKYNLDPFGTASDDELWSVVTRSHLLPVIKNLPGQLMGQVSENGENFSVGQRQMICLARAMLRKAKILVLDEATASVDVETDHLIQKTIREEFKSATTLTIAHRLNTIIDSDRILVLDAGKAVEYGTPHELLQRPDGIFASLVDDTGPTTSRHLRDIAAGIVPILSEFEGGRSPAVGGGGGGERGGGGGEPRSPRTEQDDSIAKFQEVRKAFCVVSRAIAELEDQSLIAQLDAAAMTREGWRSQLVELYAELASQSVKYLFPPSSAKENISVPRVLPDDVV